MFNNKIQKYLGIGLISIAGMLGSSKMALDARNYQQLSFALQIGLPSAAVALICAKKLKKLEDELDN